MALVLKFLAPKPIPSGLLAFRVSVVSCRVMLTASLVLRTLNTPRPRFQSSAIFQGLP